MNEITWNPLLSTFNSDVGLKICMLNIGKWHLSEMKEMLSAINDSETNISITYIQLYHTFLFEN